MSQAFIVTTKMKQKYRSLMGVFMVSSETVIGKTRNIEFPYKKYFIGVVNSMSRILLSKIKNEWKKKIKRCCI